MSSSPAVDRRSQGGWMLLLVVLAIEAFGGVALLLPIVFGMFEAGDDPIGQRLSVFLAALIAWIWVVVTLLAGLKLRASWVRASAITIHVLMFAAGTGVLQMGLESLLIGWALIVLALVGFFAALMARPEVSDIVDDEPESDKLGTGKSA